MQVNAERTLKPAAVFLLLLVPQKILLPYLAVEGILPDLILLALVFYTLRNGRIWGLIAAGVSGLIMDFVGGGLAGSTALSYTLAMFVAGKFYTEKTAELYLHSQMFSFIVLLAVFVNAITRVLILNYDATANIFILLLKQGVLPGFYTAFFAVFLILLYPKKGYHGAWR